MKALPNVDTILANRKLKQRFVGARHLESKVRSILGAGRFSVNGSFCLFAAAAGHSPLSENEEKHRSKTVRGSPAHAHECHLYFPVSNYCMIELSHTSGESSTDAEEKAFLETLSVVPSEYSWKHTLKCFDSDIAEEFLRSCSLLDQVTIINIAQRTKDYGFRSYHLNRLNDDQEKMYISTVCLTGEVTSEDTHFLNQDKVMLGRGSGATVRDAIKSSFASALGELNDRIIQRWLQKEKEAAAYLTHSLRSNFTMLSLTSASSSKEIRLYTQTVDGPHEDEIQFLLFNPKSDSIKKNTKFPQAVDNTRNIFWRYKLPHLPPVRRWSLGNTSEGVSLVKKEGLYGWPKRILTSLAILHLANTVKTEGSESLLRCKAQGENLTVLSPTALTELLTIPRPQVDRILARDTRSSSASVIDTTRDHSDKNANDEDDAARQNDFAVPDLLQQLQQIRAHLRLPSASFPSITITQEARHSVESQVRKLQRHLHGDVSILTRVSLRWPEAAGEAWRVQATFCPDTAELTVTEESASSAAATKVRRMTGKTVGPLSPLLLAVQALHRRTVPRHLTSPRLFVRDATTSRAALDFLLYAWFGAAPQVRTYEISTPSHRDSCTVCDRPPLPAVARYIPPQAPIIRAMLFYDLLGQRVLFAETHALTLTEAISRLESIAVKDNVGAVLSLLPMFREHNRYGASAVVATSDNNSRTDGRSNSRLEDRDQVGGGGTFGVETDMAAKKVECRPFRLMHLNKLYMKERRKVQNFLEKMDSLPDHPSRLDCFVDLWVRKRGTHLPVTTATPHTTLSTLLEEMVRHKLFGGEVKLSFTARDSQPHRAFAHGPGSVSSIIRGTLTLAYGSSTGGYTTESVYVDSSCVREAVVGEKEKVPVFPGVLPALTHLYQRALVRLFTRYYPQLPGGVVGWGWQEAVEYVSAAQELVLWGSFPLYHPQYYHTPNLLGELLQGVVGKYACQYKVLAAAETMDRGDANVAGGNTRAPDHNEEVSTVFYTSAPLLLSPTAGRQVNAAPTELVECHLHVRTIVGLRNMEAATGKEENIGEGIFLLGIGQGRNKREAWTAAAASALQSNFPAVVSQLEGGFRRLSEWMTDPAVLSAFSSGTVALQPCWAPQLHALQFELRAIAVQGKTGGSDSVVVSAVRSSPAAAFLAVVSQLEELLRKHRSAYYKNTEEIVPYFNYWSSAGHYGKSIWHGLCAAMAASTRSHRFKLFFDFSARPHSNYTLSKSNASTLDGMYIHKPLEYSFCMYLAQYQLHKEQVSPDQIDDGRGGMTRRVVYKKSQRTFSKWNSERMLELAQRASEGDHSKEMLTLLFRVIPDLLRHTADESFSSLGTRGGTILKDELDGLLKTLYLRLAAVIHGESAYSGNLNGGTESHGHDRAIVELHPLSLPRKIAAVIKLMTGCRAEYTCRRSGEYPSDANGDKEGKHIRTMSTRDVVWSAKLFVYLPRYLPEEHGREDTNAGEHYSHSSVPYRNVDNNSFYKVCVVECRDRTSDRAEHKLWRLLMELIRPYVSI